jgi:hypothetical protein
MIPATNELSRQRLTIQYVTTWMDLGFAMLGLYAILTPAGRNFDLDRGTCRLSRMHPR